MNISMIDIFAEKITNINFSEDALIVDLSDGRTISIPIVWYPRLYYATPEERSHWRLIGDGVGVHWEKLDEDISVKNIILGNPSGESNKSLEEWLNARKIKDF